MKIGTNWNRSNFDVAAHFKKMNNYSKFINEGDLEEIKLTIEKDEDKRSVGEKFEYKEIEEDKKITRPPQPPRRYGHIESSESATEKICWDTLIFISSCAATILPLVLLYYFFKALFVCKSEDMRTCDYNHTRIAKMNDTYSFK